MNKLAKQEISKLILSGQAFTNPLGYVFDEVRSLSNIIIDASELKNLVDIVTNRTSVPPIPLSVFEDLNDQLALFDEALAKAKQHTDELTGVVLDGQKNINAVIQIVGAAQDDEAFSCVANNTPFIADGIKSSLSVLNSANSLLNDVNTKITSMSNLFGDLSSNNPFSPVYGFMTKSAGIFAKAYAVKAQYEKTLSFFRNLDENQFLDDLPPEEAQEVIEKQLSNTPCQESTSEILAQIDADDNAYLDAQKIVLSKAITENIVSLLGGSCSSQFLNKLRTPALDAKLKQFTDKI